MRFIEVISGWINRHFSNEEAIYLVVFLVVLFLVLLFFGGALAPVLTGLVLAFLLQGLVKRMVSWNLSERLAVYTTFLVFMSVFITTLVFVVPLVWQQLVALRAALPGIIVRLQELLSNLSQAMPEFITQDQVNQWLNLAAGEVGSASGSLLNTLVTQVPSVVALLIYVVLVPISVFFFLKDREKLMAFFLSLLPRERPLLNEVGAEMNVQLANYVRGKVIEIFIVGTVTFVVFTLLKLNFAALLSVVVGLSVLIPFVGAAVVTIPVALVAIFQFGWSWDLAYVMISYGIIQAIDGNVLVPLLFSEANDLHPISIIVAVLAFGGLWGVWGVFFAIPLATLVKAVYNAWPGSDPPGALGADKDAAGARGADAEGQRGVAEPLLADSAAEG